MSVISIKQLLEAGVHFGHQTRRWNPKMKEYIFGERNGIYIIDLQKTIGLFKEAVDFVTDLAAQGKTILFVGTKRQAQETIEDEARRCRMYFVNNRWLGGLLTNFSTVQNSIKRYKELESMRVNGFYEKLSKKEAARRERERKKLEKNLRGIRDMDRLPNAVFIVDSNKEAIAVKEATKLNVPIIAIVDTNCDPDGIDYVIPGNDDALRAVKLFVSTIADAFLAGRGIYQAKVDAQAKEAEEKAQKEIAVRKAAKEAAKKKLEAAERAAQAVAEGEKGVGEEKAAPVTEPSQKPEKETVAKKVAKKKLKETKRVAQAIAEGGKDIGEEKAAPVTEPSQKLEKETVDQKVPTEKAETATQQVEAEVSAPQEKTQPKAKEKAKKAKPKKAAAEKKTTRKKTTTTKRKAKSEVSAKKSTEGATEGSAKVTPPKKGEKKVKAKP